MIGTKNIRCSRLVVLLLLGVFAISGCGREEGINYAIPNSVCGIEVDSRLLESILPSGDSIDISGVRRKYDGTTSGNTVCTVGVDGGDAIALDTSTSDEATTLQEFIDERARPYDVEEAEQVNGSPYETHLWPQVSMSIAHCAESVYEYSVIVLAVYVEWTDDEDFGDELRRFADSYFTERLKQLSPQACRQS